MSHYQVIVVLPQPPDASAGATTGEVLTRSLLPLLGEPDYAGGDTDPPGRWWDRWTVGGRFENAFLCTDPDDPRVLPAGDGDPRMVTAAPASLLDLGAQRAAAARKAAARWDRATGILRRHPGAATLSALLPRGGDGAARTAARRAYHAQPALRELAQAGLAHLPGCAVDHYATPRAEFVEQARAGAVPGWALIDTGGVWHGTAPPSGTDDAAARRARREYERSTNALLDALPEGAYPVMADLHA